ncbi:MAG: zinc-binding dehydrogenase [Planctomycetota bacterium]|nr:zinc-binding dehydrogenase [Planctomycetota bacterium]
MLAGRIVARGRIELVEAPEPELDHGSRASGGQEGGETGGEIIFQPRLACLCGSDLPYFDGDHPEYPLSLGHSLHEMVGTVVDSSGERFRPGDRVLAVPVDQRGLFERFRVDEERAIPLDESLPLDRAVIAQPLGTVLHALRKLPSLLGLDIAVVGQGPIGQLFCAALRNLGAREIIAIDLLESRLKTSPRLGATEVVCSEREDPRAAVSRLTAGRMADLVVEAVGHQRQAFNLTIELCRHGGRILYFGVPPQTIDGLEWSALFFKNITVHTSVDPDFRVDFPLAIRWLAEERIDVSPLVTHRYALREIQTAFETFRDRREGALKVFVEFSASW